MFNTLTATIDYIYKYYLYKITFLINYNIHIIAALNAGTVGFDRNIFSGNPMLKDLENYGTKLSPDEQQFVDKNVKELCEILDDYKVLFYNILLLILSLLSSLLL